MRNVATVPLWVRLLGLAKPYWTTDVLGRVASHVGKPLYTDPVRESRLRGAYARVLVEVNFAEPLVRSVNLRFDDGDILACSFLIENEPAYCAKCCSFGHLDADCKFNEKKEGGAKGRGRSRIVRKNVVE